MDPNGARYLKARIAQQQHWRLAEAVRNGSQAAADPDAGRLEEIGDGYRLYTREASHGSNGGRIVHRLRKTLVDGRWESSLDETA